jgi:hypothetical protein
VLQAQEAQLVHAEEVFNKLVANLQTRDHIIDKENNTLRAKVCCSVAWVFEAQELNGNSRLIVCLTSCVDVAK